MDTAVDVRADGVEPGAPRAAGRGGSWSGWPRAEVSRGADVLLRGGTSVARAVAGSIVDPRRPRAQPQERRRRHPARAARRRHRALGLGQVVARVRHALRRGAAPLRRVALGLRAAVPRADGEARLRRHRGALAGDRDRAEGRRAGTRARPSARSPRSPTTCGCCSRASASRTAGSAASRSRRRRCSRSSTGSAALPADTRLWLYAPVVRDRKGEHKQELDELRRGGFVRVRVDGDAARARPTTSRSRRRRRTRSRCWSTASSCGPASSGGSPTRSRSRSATATASRSSRWPSRAAPRRGRCSSASATPARRAASRSRSCRRASSRSTARTARARRAAGSASSAASIRRSSCRDPTSRVADGAVAAASRARCPGSTTRCWRSRRTTASRATTPWTELPDAVRHALLVRLGRAGDRVPGRARRARHACAGRSRASSPWLERRLRETRSSWLRDEIEGLIARDALSRRATARGSGARRASSASAGGASSRCRRCRSRDAVGFFDGLALGAGGDARSRAPILKEIRGAARLPLDVGLDYLTLDRGAATLSGGEGQRIRLATQIGSRLVGRALRARRAVDRPPPARQRAAARDARRAARPRQHGARRRARPRHRSSPPTT